MAIDKSLLGSHHLVLSSMDKEKKTVDRPFLQQVKLTAALARCSIKNLWGYGFLVGYKELQGM